MGSVRTVVSHRQALPLARAARCEMLQDGAAPRPWLGRYMPRQSCRARGKEAQGRRTVTWAADPDASSATKRPHHREPPTFRPNRFRFGAGSEKGLNVYLGPVYARDQLGRP